MNYQALGQHWLYSMGNQGVMVTDSSLIIRRWNPWMEAHSGLTAEAIEGHALFEVFPDLIQRRLDGVFRRALAGEVVMLAQPFHRYLLPFPAGSHAGLFKTMQQTAHIAPLYQAGEIVGVVAIIEDVTERVAFDLTLMESEARYRTLSEHSLAGVFLVQDSLFRYINPAFAQMIGHAPAVLLDRLGPLDLIAPQAQETAAASLGLLLAGEIASIRDELPLLRSDGQIIQVELLGNQIQLGGAHAILGMALDITARKRSDSFQALQFAVTRILAESTSSRSAAVRILRKICREQQWNQAEIWWVDPTGQQLRRDVHWRLDEPASDAGAASTAQEREATTPSQELAKTVLAYRDSLWQSPLANIAPAQPPEFQAGLGIPIGHDRHIIGVMTLLSHAPRKQEPDLTRLMADIGRQMGQYLARRRAEEALQRRDAILEAVRFAAAQLLQANDWRDCITAVLARLGEAMQVESVSLYVNRSDPQGEPCAERVVTWSAATTAPVAHDGKVFCYASAGLDRWHEALSRGGVVQEEAGQWSAHEHPPLHLVHLASLLVAPIFAGQAWWGFMTCEETESGRTWNDAEVTALRAATDALGAAIARQNAQETLRQREAQLRRITDNMLDMVSQSMLDGTLVYVSPSHYQTLGYRPEEMLGRNADELLHPDDSTLAIEAFRQTRSTQRHQRVEFRYRHADGHYVWIESVCSLLYDDAGEPSGMVFASRDVTERRRTEEAMRQAQKLESLGVVAGGVAHDFNNLLASMLMQLKVAEGRLPAESLARPHLQKAATAAQRAADLTRQLLAYVGKGQFQMQELDLNALIAENIALLKATTPSSVTLTSALADGLPPIRGDRGQIQQIIMNLVINAAEAIPHANGLVTIRTALQHLTAHDLDRFLPVARPEPGTFALLSVSDNGVGMDQQTLARIFDPFFTTKFTGRGLGLSATLGITRALRGGLQVESQPGQGATFRIYFPVQPDAAFVLAQANASASTPPPPKRVRPTILVIEDEKPVREAILDLLETEDWPTLAASNGQEGLAVFERQRAQIGLVLLDLLMPVMGGRDALMALRRLDPAVRVVLMSGYDETDVLSRLEDDPLLQPNRVLTKPSGLETLIETIHDVLS